MGVNHPYFNHRVLLNILLNVLLNTKFLAEHFGVNRKTIQRELNWLQERGLIRWIGTNKMYDEFQSANNTVQSAKTKDILLSKCKNCTLEDFVFLPFLGDGVRVLNLYFSARHVIDLSKKFTRQPYPLRVRLAREI